MSFRAGRNKPAGYAEHTAIALRIHTALDMMLRGTAGIDEWRDLSDAVNVVEALCDSGKLDMDELLPVLELATEGMVAAMRLAQTSQPMKMRNVEYDAVRQLVNAYDEALARFSETTMFSAQAAVVMRIAQAKNTPDSSVTVIE